MSRISKRLPRAPKTSNKDTFALYNESMECKSTALVLFSHGSLLCGAKRTLFEHAERLKSSGEWQWVEVGFLNFSSPRFEDAISRVAESGAKKVVVVPFFLVAGKFVREDLPSQVALAREKWPELEFHIAEPLGYNEEIIDAVIDLAHCAQTIDSWEAKEVSYITAFCEERPDCPLYGSAYCKARRDGEKDS